MICYGILIIEIANQYVVFRDDTALLLNTMLEVDAISPFPKNASRALLYKRGKHKTKFKLVIPNQTGEPDDLEQIFADSKFDFEHNEEMLNKSNEEFSILGVCDKTPNNYIALIPDDIYIAYKHMENSQYLIQLHYQLKQLILPDIAPLIMIPLLEILRTDISTYKVIEPY